MKKHKKETLISKWQVVLQVTDKSGEVTKEDILATADTEEEAIELARDYWFSTCKSDHEKSKIFAAIIHPATGDWLEVAAEFVPNPKISIDNGLTFIYPEEALQQIPLCDMEQFLDFEISENVNFYGADTDAEWLERYLEFSGQNLIIG